MVSLTAGGGGVEEAAEGVLGVAFLPGVALPVWLLAMLLLLLAIGADAGVKPTAGADATEADGVVAVLAVAAAVVVVVAAVVVIAAAAAAVVVVAAAVVVAIGAGAVCLACGCAPVVFSFLTSATGGTVLLAFEGVCLSGVLEKEKACFRPVTALGDGSALLAAPALLAGGAGGGGWTGGGVGAGVDVFDGGAEGVAAI